MPHVIVKMWPGRSERKKQEIAEEVTKAIMKTTGYGPDAVSVGIEEVRASDWTAEVYGPDIQDKPASIYKQPGYAPS